MTTYGVSSYASGPYSGHPSTALGAPAPVIPPVPSPDTSFPTFDVGQTILYQYAHSARLLSWIESLAGAVNGAALFNSFYVNVWDLDTAQGFGLDVWGRIVGVSRILQVPTTVEYFGFIQSVDGYPFGTGIFYDGTSPLTQNYALSDTAFRRLIYAKAKSNIWDGSIAGINQILMFLFASYGNCYVVDGQDMTMTYTFASRLEAVDYAIVAQSGVLPRPAGVETLVSMP